MNAKELNLCLRLSAIPIVIVLLVFPLMPGMLDWYSDMASVSPLNQQIFWVHNAFVALMLLLQAIMLLRWPEVLTSPSQAGLLLCWGMVMFWMLRLAATVVYLPFAFESSFAMLISWGGLAPLLLLNGIYLATLRHQLRAMRHNKNNSSRPDHHHTLTRAFDV